MEVLHTCLMSKLKFKTNDEIIFYQNDDGDVQIEVLYSDENVWLNTEKIAKLFEIERSVIAKHINIE